MKAPKKIHAFLESRGFGYGEGSYMAFFGNKGIAIEVKLNRYKKPENGVLIEVMVFYPSYGSAFGILPLVAGCLRADGTLWRLPSEDEAGLYFSWKDIDTLHGAIDQGTSLWVKNLLNADLMIQFLDYLMGNGNLPEIFQHVEDTPYLDRKETRGLLLSKVAYLIMAERFSDALTLLCLRKVQIWESDPNTKKLMMDAEAGRICVSAEYVEWMRKKGAQIPSSLSIM